MFNNLLILTTTAAYVPTAWDTGLHSLEGQFVISLTTLIHCGFEDFTCV